LQGNIILKLNIATVASATNVDTFTMAHFGIKYVVRT